MSQQSVYFQSSVVRDYTVWSVTESDLLVSNSGLLVEMHETTV